MTFLLGLKKIVIPRLIIGFEVTQLNFL